MTAEASSDLPDCVDTLIEKARARTAQSDVPELLRLTAALLEHCGYVMARGPSAAPVTRLMLLSSEVDALARSVSLDGDPQP